MKGHTLKKILSCLISAIILMNPLTLYGADTATESGMFDDSIKDISVVLGTGAVGAILGLSTLSFAEKPKDHLKNIAIGGAVGIVIGVGIVIFGQATKSQSSILTHNVLPETPESQERLIRKEFTEVKIAQNYLTNSLAAPILGFNFSF